MRNNSINDPISKVVGISGAPTVVLIAFLGAKGVTNASAGIIIPLFFTPYLSAALLQYSNSFSAVFCALASVGLAIALSNLTKLKFLASSTLMPIPKLDLTSFATGLESLTLKPLISSFLKSSTLLPSFTNCIAFSCALYSSPSLIMFCTLSFSALTWSLASSPLPSPSPSWAFIAALIIALICSLSIPAFTNAA